MQACDLPKTEQPISEIQREQTEETEQEKRITRLEENFYFQERQLSELQDGLLAQGREIALLKRQLASLQENVALLSEFLVEARGGDPGKEPLPPHYLPEDFLHCWKNETKRES